MKSLVCLTAKPLCEPLWTSSAEDWSRHVLLSIAQSGENWGGEANGPPSDRLNIFNLEGEALKKPLKIFSPVLGRSSDLKENFKALFCFLNEPEVWKTDCFLVQQSIPMLAPSGWAPQHLSAEDRQTLCLANRHLYCRCFSSTDVKKPPRGTRLRRTLSAGWITAVQPLNITPYFCCQRFGSDNGFLLTVEFSFHCATVAYLHHFRVKKKKKKDPTSIKICPKLFSTAK